MTVTRPLALAGFAGIVCAAGAAIMLSNGIVASPDGWAYWEGSVSLLRRGAYTYFGGQPITAWPPLYAALLAAAQALAGVSGATLIGLTCVLAGVSGAVWTYPLFAAGGVARWLAAVFVAAFIPTVSMYVLSEELALPLLGALLIALTPCDRRISASRAATLAALFAALLLTRNANLVLAPAIAVVLATHGASFKAHVLALGAPLLVWSCVRLALGQTASHGIGGANFALDEYAGQMLQDLFRQFGPLTAGIGAVVFTTLLVGLAWADRSSPHLIVAVATMVGSCILFSVSSIDDPLAGRFLWGVVLCLIVGAGLAADMRFRVLVAVLAVAALVQVERTAQHLAGAMRHSQIANIQAEHTISPEHVSAPPTQVGKQLLVAPPDYPWVKRLP